jgi:DNA-binding response OmpR family regulator
MADSPANILCIDDDPDVLFALDTFLHEMGYAVRTAPCAEDGLAAYDAQRADLILVDLMMEDIDSGLQLVQAIRDLGDAPPIIMLSSVGDQMFREIPASNYGLDGVLQKPVDKDRLINLLEAKLQQT